jgi:DNA polymerase elongation subunit (family B)
MEQNKFFAYSWNIDDTETEITAIRCYGINENNMNVCIRVNNFTPYAYVELPDKITWTPSNANLVGAKIDEIMKKYRPLKKIFEMKKKLYGAHLDGNGQKKLFPYLCCYFSNRNDIRSLVNNLRKPIFISGIGPTKLKVHEQDADPILQLVCNQDIPTAGWIEFFGKPVPEEEKVTLCDYEFYVKYEKLRKVENDFIGHPKIMGYDIEVNSTNPSMMPRVKHPGDKIFQISCILSREGTTEDEYVKYLLSLGDPEQSIVGENVIIRTFPTESDLLEGFTALIKEENPNIIAGYNIFGFDIPYMIDRAKLNMCLSNFDKQSFHKYQHAKEKLIKWSSSAYGTQEFLFLDAEGRLFVDLLPLIKREYKMDNYKLKTISTHFIGQTKEDLSVHGIFKCYRIGTKRDANGEFGRQARKAMGICGKYCLMDSILVLKIMEKIQTWVGLCEMASTTNTQIFSLYTQGQQIKVFSQAYKYCLENNIIVEKDGYVARENERYMGAHVFEPIAGVYDRVIPFDFCFTGDTLITMSNGCSKRIDSLVSDELLLGYKDGGLRNFTTVNGLQYKGERETVKVYLQDGTTFTCTPEHKIMDQHGEWVEAQNLKDRCIMRGIEYTEDKICSLEENWELEVDGYFFSMKSSSDREKSLAFARMVGYVLSDGSVLNVNSPRSATGTRKTVEVYLGTMLDAKNFMVDIKKISGTEVKIRKRCGKADTPRSLKGTTYCITFPAKLANMVHSLENIVVGKRSTQGMKLPEFVMRDDCPMSIIREFLGGLYGGDGSAPCYLSTNRFSSVSFKWTTVYKFMNEMIDTFNILLFLHNKLGLDATVYNPVLVKYGINSIIPKDISENPRYNVELNLRECDSQLFLKNIGFRYCINKSSRLSIVSSYQNMCIKTRQQHSRIVDRTNELIEKNITNVFARRKGMPTFKSCLEQSRNELICEEPPISLYSLSSVYDIGYRRHEAIRHPDKPRKLSLQSKKFKKPKEYIDDLGVNSWFSYTTKNVYTVSGDDVLIPCFGQKVIDVRANGLQKVYDIEVDVAHNFVANGVVAHNCSLYPTTIIAYNIDYSTLVSDDDPVPDHKCHVMEWEEHLGCSHDPNTIRRLQLTDYIATEKEKIKVVREKKNKAVDKFMKKEFSDKVDAMTLELKPYVEERSALMKSKPKIITCEQRYYRFLKEPKGVFPTILQNLLDARKRTRSVIKRNCSLIESEKHSENTDANKILTLQSINNVLDKRQLAYKISANSVGGPTPVPCLVDGKFKYLTIEELSKGDWIDQENIQVSTPIDNLQIWSDIGYTNVTHVMRHKMEKPLVRVGVHTGFVDCTEDHSLLDEHGVEVKPTEVDIGDKLLTYDLPLPDDTPNVPEHDTLTNEIIENYVLDEGVNEEGLSCALAFVWGMFFAEGTCGSYGYLMKSKTSWCIVNQDKKLLTRCQEILNRYYEEHTPKMTFNLSNKMYSNNVYHLTASCGKVRRGIINFVEIYRNLFYDARKMKRIPNIIFSSSYPIRKAFFVGYYAGDGARLLKKGIVISNKGAIGSAGLYYLSKTLGYKVSISNGKNNHLFRLQCSSSFRKNANSIKSMTETPSYEPIKFLKPNIIRNGTVLTSGNMDYRGINISCERIPRQKLLDRLNESIVHANERGSTILEYNTETKKCGMRQNCCGKIYTIQIRNLRNENFTPKCSCNDIVKNNIEIISDCEEDTKIKYEEIEEFVYDVETESHHFAAGVGNLIVHNSMYGAMGVKRGYLPFMPGAMATTYMGRKNIEIVASTIVKDFKGKLVYGDSVTEDTPVLCRLDNKIFYRTIDDVSNGDWEYHRGDKEVSTPIENLEVWTETGFTKIKKVIRHRTDKELFRVLVQTGVVDVTEDHGLLDVQGNKVSPKEIDVGFGLMTSNLPQQQVIDDVITSREAYIWGVFYSSGNCDKYRCCISGDTYYWSIDSQDTELLKRCRDTLKSYTTLNFQIFKIRRNAYKLVVYGMGTNVFVERWKNSFYDKRKYKIVPDIILWSSEKVRQAFFSGYCDASGKNSRDECLRFNSLGKIGSAGLYYLTTSIGYQVSVNVDSDMYELTCTKGEVQARSNSVEKLYSIGTTTSFVYDLETENHHFSAGVGNLIVHNTDSNYIHFEHLTSVEESWAYAEYVAQEISKMFPPPIKLDYEEVIYWRFFILTKKRYMYKSCGKDGVVSNKIGKKGVLLARRDNSMFVRNIYEQIIMKIFNRDSMEEIFEYILEYLNKLFSNYFPYRDFVVTKAVGDTGGMVIEQSLDEKGKETTRMGQYKVKLLAGTDNPDERERQLALKNSTTEKEYYEHCLPAQVQLAEKMKRRGQLVEVGTRLEYVITNQGGLNGKQYTKIESVDYFANHREVLKIDFMYYLKILTNPLDQILNIINKNNSRYKKDLILEQYKLRLRKTKVVEEINNLFTPKIILIE